MPVQKLKQFLERTVAYSKSPEISGKLVEEILRESDESLYDVRREHESRKREDLLAALRESDGNISRTAERLGMSRQSVYRLMEKFRIPIVRETTGVRSSGTSRGSSG